VVQKKQLILVDDIDGSPAEETVHFALDGTEYEVDLNQVHAKALRESFAEWIGSARRVRGRNKAGGWRSRSVATPLSDTADVRAWARQNGYTVSDRGRIPSEVREAYASAH
jgi:hypothetical protein